MVNVEEKKTHSRHDGRVLAIFVGWYGGVSREQLQEFGKNIPKESMKKTWTILMVGLIGVLEKLNPLISLLIRKHYTANIVGGCGYQRYRRDVEDF